MSTSPAQLYQLLPAIYRIRDAAQGGQLQDLLAIFQDVVNALDQDIQGLYENWFIETCAEWVVPYIGDFLRSRPLYSADPNSFSARAYVAHTLSYRRRKGTAVVLAQLAADVTGWPARAVEFFQLIKTTQYLNHLRPGSLSTPDLRDTSTLELLDGPFDQICHTVDVRGIVDPPLDPELAPDLTNDIAARRGKYNIANVGLFLWRLGSYAVTHATPRPATDGTDGHYRFNPLGLDEPLFNQPQLPAAFTNLASESDVPGALRRRALYDELESRRQTLVDQQSVWLSRTSFALGAEIVDSNGNTERVMSAGTSSSNQPTWPTTPGQQVSDGSILWQLVAEGFALNGVYFAEPVLQIFPTSTAQPIPPEQIMICDLSDLPPPASPHTWRQPPSSKVYLRSSDGASITLPIQVSVDPVLGRIAFPATSVPATPAQVQVSYSYGFSGELGGGPYNRIDSVSPLLAGASWQVAVSQELAPQPGVVFSSLTGAIAAWNQRPPGQFGVIAILDSRTYVENLTGSSRILIPEGSKLLVVAADWPSLRLTGSSASTTLAPTGVRPHLRASIEVAGNAPADSDNAGVLLLNGLLIEGNLTVDAGNLSALQLTHSTLVPAGGGLTVAASAPGNVNLSISLQRTICGPINLPASVPILNITDCIVDAGAGVAITAPGTDANLQSTTVLGTIGTATGAGLRTLQAGNSIFCDLVNVERLQAGCVRFCSLPIQISRVPRRYRCQPDLALANVTDPAVQAQLQAELTPLFTSTQYGNPGYAQLSVNCASAIRAGGDNGSEMGAFYYLNQPQRDSNLRTALLEYLRFGLQAGIFYVS